MADTTDATETTSTDEVTKTEERNTSASNDASPDEKATESQGTQDTQTKADEQSPDDDKKATEDNTQKSDVTNETTTETKTDTTTDEKVDSPKIPDRMKGLVQIGYDENIEKILKWAELPTPKPSEYEVLIKVEAASLNPVDWKIAKGWMSAVIKKEFPFVAGRDCSGVIVQCGSKVDTNRLKIGMRVAAHVDPKTTRHGTFGEYTSINSLCVAEIPDTMSFTDAASMPLVAQTAYQALVDKGQLGYKGAKNQKVLIFGGSTAVGHYAIQIAKAFEASEIVVTSSKEELCTSLGATKVYNYKNKEQNTYVKDLNGKNFDIAFDCVGGKINWDNSQKILKKNGRYVTIVGDTTHGGKLTFGNLFSAGTSTMNRKFWQSMGYQSYDIVFTNSRKNLQDIIKLFSQNKLRTVIDNDSPYNVTNIFDAFTKSMNHKASGKLVIEIDGSKIIMSKKPQEETKTETKEQEKKEEEKQSTSQNNDQPMASEANKTEDVTTTTVVADEKAVEQETNDKENNGNGASDDVPSDEKTKETTEKQVTDTDNNDNNNNETVTTATEDKDNDDAPKAE